MGYFDVKTTDFEYTGSLLPKKGKSYEETLAELEAMEKIEADELHGHLMLYKFSLPQHEEVGKIAKEAHLRYLKKNALFDTVLPGFAKMEKEVKFMAAEILNGDKDTRVNMTSGGTESIYCAMHAAREWARVNKPDISEPEIVAPYSVHAAFSKWCRFTGIKLKRIPLGADYRADVGAMENAISKNTIAIVGSSPCWPYGLFDPIADLAELAQKHNLWMHSDCCLGGYLSPWVEKLGYKLPPCDFRVPGVCSISADLHKYGYSTKPCSTVLYKNEELHKYHQCDVEDWPCGTYHSEGILGSRPAGPIASAWAVMNYLGEEGYLSLAKRTMEVRQRYIDGINSIEDFKCWETDLSVIVFETGELDMLSVLSGIFQKGFVALPVFEPPLVQICPDPVDDDFVDRVLEMLKETRNGVRSGAITADFLFELMA